MLLYLHYYLQFGFGQLLTILLMKSLFPLQQFWLLPWQCKQWEEEEEWRALTSLWDPPPPFRPFCQEQLHCWDMRVAFFFFGSTEWEAQVVQALNTVNFCQSAYSVTVHGLKKKIKNNSSTFCRNVMWLTDNLYKSLSFSVTSDKLQDHHGWVGKYTYLHWTDKVNTIVI